MKIVVVGVCAVALAGCGLPSRAYKTLTTKQPEVCDQLVIGQTTRIEAEVVLGRPKGVKTLVDGRAATYRSGYFTAKVQYDAGGIVRDYECSKE